MTNYDIHTGDVLEWCKSYTGEKFHALLCDPPYHLTTITKRFGKSNAAPAKKGVYARASKGFMGQQWDGGDIAFRPETWAALGEHLHPGAFGMAFASSRGWHRMAVAIEDAGFVLHPTVFLWAFGCLSEDTEILTEHGWKLYRDISVGDKAMCYNVETSQISCEPIEGVYQYDYKDTAYRIHSDTTDQIVSRNHRVIVERGGKQVFRFAETLEQKEIVPVLENMQFLPNSFYRSGCKGIPQEKSLFQAMLHSFKLKVAQRQDLEAEISKKEEIIRRTQGKVDSLCSLSKESMETRRVVEKGQDAHLFHALQREVACDKPDKTLAQRTPWLDAGNKRPPSTKDDGGRQSRLERWCNLFSQAWELFANQVCQMSVRVFGNGAQGWLCYGASPSSGSSYRQMFATPRSSASYRPQSTEQCADKPNVIPKQLNAQEIRSTWVAKTTLATITPIQYEGIVWCVKVPAGAFVARRNGKVFVTGNSGFPKATRVDTQIQPKSEQVDVGEHPNARKSSGNLALLKKDGDGRLREPTDEMAKVWTSHRYGLQAMKPAVEPIIVFQKPYEGKPIDNMVATGAGALNIDGARIPYGDETDKRVGTDFISRGGDASANENDNQVPNKYYVQMYKSDGRWPANFIVDEITARLLDKQSGIKKGGFVRNQTDGARPFNNDGKDTGYVTTESIDEPDGGASRYFFNVQYTLDEADPVFYTAKVSNKERNVGLEHMPPPTRGGMAGTRDQSLKTGSGNERNNMQRNPHPTLKPISLTEHLATLLLPPDAYAPRRLIIPFSGAGSEMIGALLAGWEHIQGIEFSQEYTEIAKARLAHWAVVKHSQPAPPVKLPGFDT